MSPSYNVMLPQTECAADVYVVMIRHLTTEMLFDTDLQFSESKAAKKPGNHEQFDEFIAPETLGEFHQLSKRFFVCLFVFR